MRDDDDLRRVAKARAEHMPAEGIRNRLDPNSTRPGKTGDSRAAGPPEGEGQVRGIRGLPRSSLDLGDESTGGEAAEQAIGARPEESGTEIEDRTRR
ncbi:MAG TPA: hypothetical protein VFX61_12805 [Micromonosporaceae bacterium]|nr:hypothetical protein [Micromonosporaceae bacterium]